MKVVVKIVDEGGGVQYRGKWVSLETKRGLDNYDFLSTIFGAWGLNSWNPSVAAPRWIENVHPTMEAVQEELDATAKLQGLLRECITHLRRFWVFGGETLYYEVSLEERSAHEYYPMASHMLENDSRIYHYDGIGMEK